MRLWVRLILIASGFLMGLLLIEGFFRLLFYSQLVNFYVYEPTFLGYENRYHHRPEGRRAFRYSVPKPSNTVRVVLLGDSNTEASHLPLAQTAGKILEVRLQGTVPCSRMEVINAGVGSFSPLLEYLYTKYELLKYQPDLVILNYDMGDVQDDFFYSRYAEFDSQGHPIRVRPTTLFPWEITDIVKDADLTITDINQSARRYNERIPLPSELVNFLRRRSFAWANLRHYVKPFLWFVKDRTAFIPPAKAIPGDINTDRYGHMRLEDYKWDPYFAVSFRYLKDLRDLLGSHGVKFLVTVYPYGVQVDGGESAKIREQMGFRTGITYSTRLVDALEAFGRQESIQVVNTLEAFRTSRARPLFYDDNIHLNSNGQGLLADVIFKRLVHSGMVPTCDRTVCSERSRS